jgi:hypothetical protein
LPGNAEPGIAIIARKKPFMALHNKQLLQLTHIVDLPKLCREERHDMAILPD